ncbi:LacI family DNA-binding transcriptional regulator [Alloscardovia macacae]|uniref:LacI family transcriptional regulator n=1 Tax=Alloscardovia macacae TaxID=1160091 RepID=A0A261F451_9BIFI|nr:LacI family DNA-binding transcriptional regulator [Alloscardovia macacae]OZG53884.1 LacI family transcriptional regulator [Alloscardovia macacae]
MKKATIADVAEAAGVSTYTVSRALRGLKHVNEETRKKVLEAAKKLNYSASPTAAALATGRTNRIALLVRENLSGWFTGEITEGIYDTLFPQEYDLILYRAGNENERSEFFRRRRANQNADALIISGFGPNEEERDALAKLDMPIVSINASHAEYAHASVSIHDIAGEESAVRYLAALGHTRFAYIGRANRTYTWGDDERLLGYQNAVSELHLNNRGTFELNEESAENMRSIIAEIIAMPDPPTALCIWSDTYALKAVHELRRMGIRCPEDISVIGFDGQPAALDAGLSTVQQPAREIGAQAAQIALDLFNKKDVTENHLILPTRVIPLDTTSTCLPPTR